MFRTCSTRWSRSQATFEKGRAHLNTRAEIQMCAPFILDGHLHDRVTPIRIGGVHDRTSLKCLGSTRRQVRNNRPITDIRDRLAHPCDGNATGGNRRPTQFVAARPGYGNQLDAHLPAGGTELDRTDLLGCCR